MNNYIVYITYINYLPIKVRMSFTFASLTLADLALMSIHREVLPLGQPQEVAPATGSQTYQGHVKSTITHFRIAPYDHSSPIQCILLGPRTSITVIVDPRYPTWAYINTSNSLRGWVGIQHVSSAPAYVPAPASVAIIPSLFSTVALVPITHTYASPFMASPQVGCIVPRGSKLIVIAVTTCGQWFQLHGSNTWIPASWVQ